MADSSRDPCCDSRLRFVDLVGGSLETGGIALGAGVGLEDEEGVFIVGDSVTSIFNEIVGSGLFGNAVVITFASNAFL